MTREEYLQIRNKGDVTNLIYTYYVHSCAEKGYQPLEPNKFFTIFSMWFGKDEAIENVMREYDLKFDIRTLSDPKGRVIRYL